MMRLKMNDLLRDTNAGARRALADRYFDWFRTVWGASEVPPRWLFAVFLAGLALICGASYDFRQYRRRRWIRQCPCGVAYRKLDFLCCQEPLDAAASGGSQLFSSCTGRSTLPVGIFSFLIQPCHGLQPLWVRSSRSDCA